MNISRIENDRIPYGLLLLADEEEQQIAKYKDRALFWAAYEKDEVMGIIGLTSENSESSEIVNIAVEEKWQNRKIGTALIEEVVAFAKGQGNKEIIIKTGNSSLKQLHLYQSCGFRMERINKDFFTKNYGKPLYENSLPCVDQIVLKYKVYSAEESDRIVKEYWNRFLEINPDYQGRSYEAWNFGYGESQPNKLLALVKERKKQGTSSARELYEEGEILPQVGDLSVITYGNGLPGCVIETKDIRVLPFKGITPVEARLEGEGDLSLEYWRREHEAFFQGEYEQVGKAFTEAIPVIFEQFEVIYDEDRTLK
jgi:uncharacterized protein YhfF/N-acetylglutamate synthase-like GNAT family acetyltransferase